MADLVSLTAADLGEVMRIERLPGYDVFHASFTADEHAAEFASADAHYLGFRHDGGLAGFVILQELRAPTVSLRRISVREPGQGIGAALFRAAVDWVFANTDAEAVKLHVRPENHRARHVYLREGFTPYRSDETGDLMSVTRARWSA
ncbi:MAG: GNAT family N-acetyltransferase [Phenylobacterium sp.]